ncbi:MAG: GNAT family acetyltransferase [Lactimicrobium sp.]|jgi:hypothetical protein|uniref:GNAT family acetyltransferase n=1 Tax=Lactimicrobium sp. TaxID=2563780 RepID=UPI002F34F283
MKLLIMCEGPNEKKIMEILLANGCLKFSEDDLLGLTIYHARQIRTSAQVRTELNIYPGKVKVIRIGDKQSDILRIPSEYKSKIQSVEKYCTKPELEMLLIIAEGMESDFAKVKSKVSPKSYAKTHISFHGRKYDNSTEFYEEYFEGRPELLMKCIRIYRKINGAHEKDEHYLEELLK